MCLTKTKQLLPYNQSSFRWKIFCKNRRGKLLAPFIRCIYPVNEPIDSQYNECNHDTGIHVLITRASARHCLRQIRPAWKRHYAKSGDKLIIRKIQVEGFILAGEWTWPGGCVYGENSETWKRIKIIGE